MGENQTKGKRGNNVHEKEALEITPRNALGVHDNPLGLGITKRDIVMKTEKAVRKRKLYVAGQISAQSMFPALTHTQ